MPHNKRNLNWLQACIKGVWYSVLLNHKMATSKSRKSLKVAAGSSRSNNENIANATAARSTSNSASKKSKSSMSTSAHKIKSELIGDKRPGKYIYNPSQITYLSCEIPTATKKNPATFKKNPATSKKNSDEAGQAARIKKLEGNFFYSRCSSSRLTYYFEQPRMMPYPRLQV